MRSNPPEPHVTPSPATLSATLAPTRRWTNRRIPIVLATTVSYALVFIPAYTATGVIAASFSVVPIAVTGWLFGRRGGLLAGLLSIPLHIILFTLAGTVGWQVVIEQWPGSVMGIVLGVLMGWLGAFMRRVQAQSRDLAREQMALRLEIAERERVEHALQQAKRDAEAASRAKSTFLANMSHELRTPLTAIAGWADILREEMCGPITLEQREGLDTIDRSARHLLALITDVLDLAKIEAGKAHLEIQPVAVEWLCQASIELIAATAAQKRLTVSLVLDPDVISMHADQRALKQILVNLLSNAVKFTAEQGAVGLEVHGDREQQSVSFTVWDTGIGISAADIERLFQPFEQIDNSFTRRWEGSGLGLALVARLVEMHEGRILVNSTVGQGSRFTVTLPRTTRPPEPDLTLAAEPGAGAAPA